MIREVRARSKRRQGGSRPAAWASSISALALAVALLAIPGCGGDSAAPAVAQGGGAPPPGGMPTTTAPSPAAAPAPQAAAAASPPAQALAAPISPPAAAPPSAPPTGETQAAVPAAPTPSTAGGSAVAEATSAAAPAQPTAAPPAESKPDAAKVASRPDDFSKWKPDDFRAARAEFDPRLVDAIAALGPARAKNEKAAALLVELLKPPPGALPVAAPPPAAAPPAAPPPGAVAADPGAPKPPIALPPGFDPKMLPEGFDPALLNSPQVRAMVLNKAREQGGEEAVKAAEAMLAAFSAAATGANAAAAAAPGLSSQSEDVIVPAIIESLGANQTDTARKALKQLLLGQIKTGVSDVAATGLAARAILQQPSSEEQELIIAAALDGSKLRPGGTADPGLQAQIVAALETSAPAEVRGKLVEFALRKSAPEEQRKAMLALLMKPVPGNLAAQAKLFHSPKTDSATRTELERQFAAHSAAAIDRLLGLTGGAAPADADPAVSGEAPSDTTMLRSVVDNVWGEEVMTKLDAEASAADDVADFSASIPLAVAMPVTGARTMFSGFLHEYWDEGPGELKLGAKFGDLVHDPGQLIVAKRVPRKEKPVEKKKKTDNPPPVRQRRGRNSEGKNKAEKQEKMRYEWMHASEEFVQSLNARFLTAAQAGVGQRHLVRDDKAARKKTTAATTGAAAPTAASRAGRFPLELLEDSKIIAEYHVCWPEDLSKRLWPSNLSPLAVHYVKLEDNATMTKLNTQYSKQLKGATSRKRPYGRWIDWYGQGVQHGQTRSVDVMLTRSAPAAADEEDDESTSRKVTAEEPEPFVTEILIVEIPEFRASATGEEETAAKTK